MNLYETLDVPADADAETIKRAYRKAAQHSHPDRETGSTESFQAVRRAYEVLSDETARKRYDETGETDDSKPDTAEQTLMHMMDQLISNVSFQGDYIARATEVARLGKEEIGDRITVAERKIRHFEKLIGRVKRNSEAPNFFEELTAAKLATARQELKKHRRDLETMDRVLELLGDFSDTTPTTRDPYGMPPGTMQSRGPMFTRAASSVSSVLLDEMMSMVRDAQRGGRY